MATKKTAEAAESAADISESTAPVGEAPLSAPNTELKAGAAKKSDVDDAGFCVYIGPSITGVIQSGTIYTGSKAQALSDAALAVEKYPLVAELIVTGNTLAVDRIKVKTPGNLLYVNYKKLASRKNK